MFNVYVRSNNVACLLMNNEHVLVNASGFGQADVRITLDSNDVFDVYWFGDKNMASIELQGSFSYYYADEAYLMQLR